MNPVRRRRRRHASFIACTQVRVCVRTGPRAHTPEWLLIFETTLITKKRGSEGRRDGGREGKKKNCTTWPKAIKGTLISLAIMLWGILNSVISARYIRRKVSGNCFVLLEQRLGGDELTRLRGPAAGRLLPPAGHLYAEPPSGPPCRTGRRFRSSTSVD